jgi:hypothetical protein
MILCEVALGEPRDLLQADYYADKLPTGKHSTKGPWMRLVPLAVTSRLTRVCVCICVHRRCGPHVPHSGHRGHDGGRCQGAHGSSCRGEHPGCKPLLTAACIALRESVVVAR